ncbi:MAG: twin-arginine translocase subunit TatC, partial [Candidatus Eremiobacteraeota bacterium]|nr:twin-arginine translocase subunit TatC [Candidatus Eremiobacteraeota bacterium]
MLEQRPASDDVEMTFTEHLAELRRRLFIAIGAIAVAAIAGLFAVPSLLRI